VKIRAGKLRSGQGQKMSCRAVLQEQRGRKNPAKQLWEDSGRVSSDLPDVESLIENATVDRLQVSIT